jgi:RNA polymerase sigma factor (sigma-70 family)
MQATEPAATAADQHDRLVGGELRAIISRAIDALPKRRREVFVLVRYYGLTHREAAKVLDLAPQTVANHLGMALADLRLSLVRYLPDYYRSSEAESHYSPHRAVAAIGK